MKLGFKNPEWEKQINHTFKLYIDMIEAGDPGDMEFQYASQMLRNHIDFMSYNRHIAKDSEKQCPQCQPALH